jgi:hypothetical protein
LDVLITPSQHRHNDRHAVAAGIRPATSFDALDDGDGALRPVGTCPYRVTLARYQFSGGACYLSLPAMEKISAG